MKNKKTVIILLAALVVVIGGAAVLVNVLSGYYQPDNLLVVDNSQAVEEPAAGDTAGEGAVPTEDSAAPEDDGGEAENTRMLAPDITVEDADGNPVKLSDLRGTPVVLNFWASWCPPCKYEMPEFDKVNSELDGAVAFMMVDLVDGDSETKETGMAYIAEQGYQFPVYYDTTQEAAYAYGVSSIPMTLFVDAEGYLVTMGRGMLSEESLRRGIDMIR